MRRATAAVLVLATLVAVWALTREAALPVRPEVVRTDPGLAVDAGVAPVPVAPPHVEGPAEAPASEREELTVLVVEEETGTALPGARVAWVVDVNRRPEGEGLLDAWTADEHGAVTAKVEARGALIATAEGHVWSASLNLGGEVTAPVTLRCARGLPVRGRVVDARGRGLPGLAVTVENEVDREALVPRQVSWNRVTTDATGWFESAVREGATIVRAGSGPWKVSERQVTPPSPPVVLVLEPGFAVSGRVLEPDGGPGSFAVVEYGDSNRVAADVAGRFQVDALDELPELAATSQDELRHSVPVTPAARLGATAEVTLRLEEPLAVRGVVLDEAGKPVPGASLVLESVADDEPPLVPLVSDLTGPADLHADDQGAFTLDTGLVDTRRHVEVLGWTAQTHGAVRAHPGERVELVLHHLPMVTGVVTAASGRRLENFRLAGTPVASPQGTFAVPRSVLGTSLAIYAEGFATRVLELPDAGVDLGVIALSATHVVRLEPVITPLPRELLEDGRPIEPGAVGNRPSIVLLDDDLLTPSADGGLLFEASLPNQTFWVSGRAFQSRRIEVGGNDEVVRVELNAGAWLVVHPDVRGLDRTSWLSLEDCVPPRAPSERHKNSLPWHDGWWFGGLSAGSCRLVLTSGDLEGTAHVDLPAEGSVSVTIHLTESQRRVDHFMGVPMLRGQQPTRHRGQ